MKHKDHSSFNAGMAINLEADDDLLLIQAYGDGGFKVQNRRVSGAMIINGTGYYPLEAQSVADISYDMLAALEGEALPEIVLIGTGKTLLPVSKAFRLALDQHTIPFDVMDTGAAARTYNILTLEGRKVTALLLPVL